eukprot:357794-Chlamydomonas_euryale.AAC.7
MRVQPGTPSKLSTLTYKTPKPSLVRRHLLLELFVLDERETPLASSSPGRAVPGVEFFAASRHDAGKPDADATVLHCERAVGAADEAYTDAAGLDGGGATARRVMLPVGQLTARRNAWPQTW